MIVVDILRHSAPSESTIPPTISAPPDTTQPTVTINQAAGQVDPTSASSINFTAVFSEPVSGFIGTDVTISGTAGGTKTVTVTGGPSSYNVAVSGMTTDGTVIASIAAGVAQDASGNLNTASTSTDNSVSFAAYDPQILWSAHMETQNLSEWDEKVNSGIADTTVVNSSVGVPPHGGSWMMKQSVTVTGGTRMSIYGLLHNLAVAGTSYYYTFWHYFPVAITFPIGDSYIFWGTVSPQTNVGAPFWDLVLNQSGGTSQFIWSPNNQAPNLGPHSNESGGKRVYDGTTVIPIAQWNKWEIFIKPRSDFTGQMKVWLNGVVEYDMDLVKTMYPDVGQNVLLYTEQTGYGSNLSPSPAISYVDDVTVSLNRMP